MSVDLSSLESTLGHLRPATLDPALLARLDACADRTWTGLSAAECALAKQLEARAPAPLPAALLAALEAIVCSVRFPAVANIVRFPDSRSSALSPLEPSPPHPRAWWSAAAAVALIGAAAAWWVPTRHAADALAASPPARRATLPARPPGQLIPAGFHRGLTEARDEGVIWPTHTQAQRVVRVVYQDRVTLKDSTGKTYQLEQPRVEYILVPANAD